MADLYAPQPHFINAEGAGQTQPQQQGITGDEEVDRYLQSLPETERDAALQRLTAPPTGDELARKVQTGYTPSLEDFDAIDAWHKNHEVNIAEGIGAGIEQVMGDLGRAVGAVVDHPMDALFKSPANVAEGFAQGTRNFYGMAAQSADPSSLLFRFKNFLNGTGTKEERYNQYIEALNFNRESESLMKGEKTLVMDKDMITPEIVQAASYIADPTLFIPFGVVASAGMRAVGLGEKMMLAGAKATAIKNGLIGGTLKWGVGAPVEFLGGAVRNTIDYGIERGASAIAATTGMSAEEIAKTTKLSGLPLTAASFAGHSIPYVGAIAETRVFAGAGAGIGEAIGAVGETMLRNRQFGRGINSWAREALENTPNLSGHAKGLLKVLDAVDPMFTYTAAVTKGATHGAMIGGTLGYLSGGEEGLAHGLGAGIALGAVGGGAGKVVADVTNGTLFERVAIQRKMVIEGLKTIEPDKAMAFEALVKAAEASGDRSYMAHIDGIIAGVDKVAPNSKFFVRSTAEHIQWLRGQGFDETTGRIAESNVKFPELGGGDRRVRGRALGFLSQVGDQFVGKPEELIKFLQSVPQDHALRKAFFRLDGEQKQVILDTLKAHGDPEFVKTLGGKKFKDYYGDINYAEMSTARVNDLFTAGDIAGARKLHETFLKDNTGKDGVLNDRGRMLRNKLAADGYFDKDGNLRPRRLTADDDQPTARLYAGNEGFVIKRNATGAIEVHLSLDNLSKDGAAHELFHAIFKESVLRPDFIDRLSKDLLGTFDKDGKLIKAGSVNRRELRDFFSRYIDLTNDKLEDFKDESARLNSAIREFETGSEAKTISPEAIATLHQYVEEFGAYYFQNWLRAQSPDFLFRGGKLEGMRGLMDSTKNGWLDFWERSFQSKDPTFRFGELAEGEIDGGFKTQGGKRIRVSSLDYFNRDFIRATADTNKGNFDINKLSQEGQAHYINANGIRNTHRVDNTGRAVRLSRREAAKANITAGKEIYKILKGINPNRAVDGDGNFIGRLNDAEMDAIVKSGHVNRAWVNKLKMAYEILDGKQSNVAEFGYLGKTEQTTDASYPRLFGDDVSFKHRKTILLGVDLKVGQNGTFHALFHTLDKAVIEARGDNLWKDSAIQDLWNGNRGAMEQDFFRYLENASKPDQDTSKRPSAELWNDGKGGQRRDALHQMLGMAKNEGDTYINRPIAEIPLGIRHSVTTFNNDGISSFRVSGTERYNYNHENAFKLLSRNWKPSEMKSEKTGTGEIITHATGFKFIKNQDGTVKAFTSAGAKIGSFDNIETAAKASEKFFNSIYDNMREGVAKEKAYQNKQATKFKPLSREQRLRAIELGDVFALDEMKDFVGRAILLRQTRDEHIYQRALEAGENPEQLLAYAEQVTEKNALINEEYKRKMRELTLQEKEFEKEKIHYRDSYDKKIDELRLKHNIPISYERWKSDNGKKLPPMYVEGATTFNDSTLNPEHYKQEQLNFAEYKEISEKAIARLQADPEHQNEQFRWGMTTDHWKTKALELMALEDGIELWKKQNNEAIQDPVFAELNSDSYANMSRQEKAEYFAKLVKGSAKVNEYSGLLEGLFAREYDDKIQQGVPFVVVSTHGTKSVELMIKRIFAAEKLGANYNITSSKLGVFSAGSQNTSGSSMYSGRPQSHTIDFTKRAEEVSALSAKESKLVESYNKEIVNLLNDEWAKGNAEYLELTKTYGNNLWYSLSVGSEKGIPKEVYERYLQLVAQGYTGKLERFVPSQIDEFQKLATMNMLDKAGWRMDWVSPELKNKFNEINDIYKLNRNGHPEVDMQLRKVIKMNNPYVIVDPRSYSEHFISPHMKTAVANGHDGIVFKRFADGGQRDNVYVVFENFMDDNIKVVDTSFDTESVPRGSDETGRVLKGGKQLNLPFKPVEWIKKDLMNHPENRQAWDRITGSGAVIQNFDIKELQGKPVLNIAPDNAFTGQLMVGDELVMKGQGGVLFAVNNIEQGGIWASSTTGAKRMFEAMKTLREADLAKGGDGTVYISIPKAVSKKVSSSENGARGYMNVINQLAKNNIISKEVVQNAIREAVKTHKGILDKNGKEMSLSGSGFDVLNKAMDAFFSEDNAKFKGRGSFVEKLVVEITKAKTNDPKKLADAQKTFNSDAPNLLTNKDVLMEAIGSLFDDPLTKDLNVGDVYAVIKVSGDFDMKQVRMHDSYNTTIVHKGGKKPQLLLLDKPKNMTEFIDSVENKDISSDKSSYTPEELKAFYEDVNKRMNEAKPRGLKGSPLNEGHNPNDFYGINSSGQAAGRFKAALKPREEVIQKATEAGYGTTVYYHGTNKDFTEFKSSPRNHSAGAGEGRESGNMFYLSSEPLDAEHYKKAWVGDQSKNRVITAFVKMDNPYDVSSNAKAIPFTPEQEVILKKYLDKYSRHPDKAYQMLSIVGQQKRGISPLFQLFERNERAAMLKEMGYDGIKDGKHISVFDSEQIKSADDFTYDDAGKEIPLSERFDKTKKDIRWKPVGYEGGDDYYKPKKNPFEYKDGEGLLVRRPFIGNDELTGDKDARGHQSNPASYNVGWEDIGHYPQNHETKGMNQWEKENSGLWVDDQKKGILAKNPAWDFDNTGYTHSEWFERYQYDDDRPLVYGRYEKPRIVNGELKERGKLSITSRYSDHFSSMAEVAEYKDKVAKRLGVNPDDIDAFYFGAGSEIKKQMGYGSKDNLPIKFKPTEASEQGSHKPRYEIDTMLVDKLKTAFKKDEQLNSYDLLRFIVDNNGFMSPLAKIMMESFDSKGLGAAVMEQGTSGKKGQKGAQGWTRSNYQPYTNRVNLVLEKVENRKKWLNQSYEELVLEEVLHSITFTKTPSSIKHGTTIEAVSKNIDYFLSNEKNFSESFEGNENRHLGTDKGWFTIARAWKEVKKSFDTGLRPDGIAMTKGDKHILEYRLSNMAEFIVGVTQDKELQAILSKIKVPKSEVSLLDKVFNAIKKIWNVGDDAMDSLLAHTSDAAERILRRDRNKTEVSDGGIYAEQSKLYTLKSPELKPAEGWRDWNAEKTAVGSVIKNTVGYLIIVSGDKFKVYNPYKAMVGIYTNLDQAKRRVQRDEPK